MSSAAPAADFHVGGALWADSPVYVERRADQEIFASLSDGHYCYVLNARQMGKSSLRVHVSKELSARGVRCATVDCSSLQEQDEPAWYWSFIGKLATALGVGKEIGGDWRKRHAELAPSGLLSAFIEEVVLERIAQSTVIFVEEIDSTLSLKFSANRFFATIRECHERRPQDPRYRRLTFALIGVARSDELARDERTTPFNIARSIDLQGFTREELGPLRAQLPAPLQSDAAIDRLLNWTGGQPLLTHKLCQYLALEAGAGLSPAEAPGLVDRIVRERILESWEEHDDPEHLRTIRTRIEQLIKHDQKRANQLLNLYAQVLAAAERGVVAARSGIELELRLTGLVVLRDGMLRASNAIYTSVFGPAWVERQLGNLRPYEEAFAAWVRSGRKDSSRLLAGDALRDAKLWAAERSLGEVERSFLESSDARVERGRRRQLQAAVATTGVLTFALALMAGLYLQRNEAIAIAEGKSREAKQSAEQAEAARARVEQEKLKVQDEKVKAESAQAEAIANAQSAKESAMAAEQNALTASANAKAADEARKKAVAAQATTQKALSDLQRSYDSVVQQLAGVGLLTRERERLTKELERLRMECAPPQSQRAPISESAP